MTLPDGVILLDAGENRRPGHVLLKASANDTRGAYALRENRVPAGFLVDPHRHRATDEAWFVIEGGLTFLVESDVVEVRTGGFVFVPRGVSHAFTNRGDIPAHFLVIFSPPGLEEMFEQLMERRARGQSDRDEAVAIRARYETDDVVVPADLWPPIRVSDPPR